MSPSLWIFVFLSKKVTTVSVGVVEYVKRASSITVGVNIFNIILLKYRFVDVILFIVAVVPLLLKSKLISIVELFNNDVGWYVI